MIGYSAARYLALLLACAPIAQGGDSLYVNYAEEPPQDLLLACEVNILGPNAKVDLQPGQRLGNRYLAYLSLVEIAPDADYLDEIAASGIPIIAENPQWQSRIADIADPRWKEFILDQLAASAIDKGFDGFFLDTVDSVELIAGKYPERSAEFATALIELVKALREKYPDAEIVINRGFPFFADLKEQIDGLLVESVVQTFDPDTGEYRPVPAADTRYLAEQIVKYREAGLAVYVVDYAAPEDAERATQVESEIRKQGAVPFLSTPDLEGTTSAGKVGMPRKIIVLFGDSTIKPEDPDTWPHDSSTAHAMLQTPLEWMGYELDYHSVADGIPEHAEGDDYAGVIVDRYVRFPFEQEAAFSAWIMARVNQGKKLLFLGDYGVSGFGPDEYFGALGIKVDDREFPASDVEIVHADEEYMNYEATVRPFRWGFLGISAPASARTFLSLAKPVPSGGDPIRYDPVFVADWGGAILEPYVLFVPAEHFQLCYVDPFKFLNSIWPEGSFPAPDTTTRDGLRIFYSHIDGDGFSSPSHIERGKTCGEVLYDEVLKDLAHPITVSFVEAEIRGQLLVQNRLDQARIETVARKILALPHCEPASHSYSHPWNWGGAGHGPEISRNLGLKLDVDYPVLDLSREIIGSLDYIRSLAPPSKPPGLMLWSGECLPTVEALKTASDAGYRNMNGGFTIVSDQHPGLTNVSPKGISWGGQFHVYSSNQNKYTYNNKWAGPYFGGFERVIETFEKTESPRRLKPVNVYYHFYSAERPAALKALKKVYSWCSDRNLHAMTAAEFSAVVDDSYHTRIFKIGHNRWSIVNAGHCRTFRLPVGAGYPDMATSRGVTGFNRGETWTFIHTDGSQRCVIAMQPDPPTRPYLSTSTAPVSVQSLTQDQVVIRAGERPTRLRLEGFEPNVAVKIRISPSGDFRSAKPSREGSFEFDLPGDGLLEVLR